MSLAEVSAQARLSNLKPTVNRSIKLSCCIIIGSNKKYILIRFMLSRACPIPTSNCTYSSCACKGEALWAVRALTLQLC